MDALSPCFSFLETAHRTGVRFRSGPVGRSVAGDGSVRREVERPYRLPTAAGAGWIDILWKGLQCSGFVTGAVVNEAGPGCQTLPNAGGSLISCSLFVV